MNKPTTTTKAADSLRRQKDQHAKLYADAVNRTFSKKRPLVRPLENDDDVYKKCRARYGYAFSEFMRNHEHDALVALSEQLPVLYESWKNAVQVS